MGIRNGVVIDHVMTHLSQHSESAKIYLSIYSMFNKMQKTADLTFSPTKISFPDLLKTCT